jgi:hypothetical protein
LAPSVRPGRRSGRWRGLGTGVDGASGGEGDADVVGGLADAGADLEQSLADGGELGFRQDVGLGYGVADGEHQPVGGGVECEAHLIGHGRAAGGSVAL